MKRFDNKIANRKITKVIFHNDSKTKYKTMYKVSELNDIYDLLDVEDFKQFNQSISKYIIKVDLV